MSNTKNRKHSSIVVDGVEKAPSRSMLRAVGFSDADFKKPQIGVASTWSMVTPCNMHINTLAEEVGKGVEVVGGKVLSTIQLRFQMVFQWATEGMKYSLVSREVIADSIETVSGLQGA